MMKYGTFELKEFRPDLNFEFVSNGLRLWGTWKA